MKKNMMISMKKIQYISLFVYIVSISAFQLETGIDPWIVRGSFVLLVTSSLLRKNIKFNIQIVWIIIFWFYYFLSLLWASNASDTMLCLNSAIQVIAISICLPNIIEDQNDIKKILNYIIISLFITSVLIFVRTPFSYWGLIRIGDVTGLHVNIVGVRMAIGALLCLYFVGDSNISVKKKILYLICIVIFVLIGFFTGSKKSIFIILLGIILYEFFVAKGIRKFSKLITYVGLAAVLWIFVMNNTYLYNVIGRRLESFIETFSGNSNADLSYIERNYFIEKAKELFRMHPILGYGGDNFMSYMREIGYSHVAYSHNNYYELLSTLGIIGFLIYYFMWFKVFFDLIKVFIKNNSKFILIFLIIISLILIMDYGNISYYSDFNTILLVLSCYLVIDFRKSEKNEIQKNS